jgi:hypothetical protein
MTTYIFRPPTVDETPAALDPIHVRVKIARGVTVILSGGVYSQVRYPASEDLAAADAYYRGGYNNVISAAEATALTAAGYGAYITTIP